MKSTWRIVAFALSAMLLTMSAAALTAHLTKGKWTDAANWLEAFATTAALAAAVAAAMLVARTVRLELDREDRRDERDQQAQAELVAAWHSEQPWAQQVTKNSGTGEETGWAILHCSVMYTNTSPLPVYKAAVEVELRWTEPGEPLFPTKRQWSTATTSTDIGVIAPGDSKAVHPKFTRVLMLPNAKEAERVELYVTLTFTDAANRRWSRGPSGLKLLSVPEVLAPTPTRAGGSPRLQTRGGSGTGSANDRISEER